MKGISMPVNLIVIIVVALLVLLALAAFFAGGFSPASGTVSDSAALQKGCGIWMSRGCIRGEATDIHIAGYNPEGADEAGFEGGTLATACERVLGMDDVERCYKYCCGG